MSVTSLKCAPEANTLLISWWSQACSLQPAAPQMELVHSTFINKQAQLVCSSVSLIKPQLSIHSLLKAVFTRGDVLDSVTLVTS